MSHSQNTQIFSFWSIINFKICEDMTTHWKCHFRLFPYNHKWYKNEIWSDIRANYEKYFQLVFSSLLKT